MVYLAADCSANQFYKQRSHLRAAVMRSEKHDPDKQNIHSLSALAKLGMFSGAVAREVEKAGRFTDQSIILHWFGQTLKPAKDATSAVAYAQDSVWRPV